MYKKLIILTVIAMPFTCSAGFGEYVSAWWHGRQISSIPMPHIPLAPQQLAQVSGGVASSNTLEAVKEARAALKDVLDHPEAVEKATSGFVKGIVKAPFVAALDGAEYVRDTAVEHPYMALTAATVGLGAAAYYKFRDLTEEEKQLQQIEKDKRQSLIRQAASISAADMHADEYRTCLNRHAYDNGTCEDRIKRCHSPARKLASYNRKRADKMTSSFREYN